MAHSGTIFMFFRVIMVIMVDYERVISENSNIIVYACSCNWNQWVNTIFVNSVPIIVCRGLCHTAYNMLSYN